VRAYWDDLRDLVHETETKASDRVQGISLIDFRHSVGDLWRKYKDRIILISDSTIARMIGRETTYIEQDDDTLILLFPGLSETIAQELTDSIATAIGDKFIGAKFALHVLPFPSTAKLNISKAINLDGSVSVETLKSEVARARAAQGTSSSGHEIKPFASPFPKQRSRTTESERARAVTTKIKPMLIPAWSADTECVDSFFLPSVYRVEC